MTREERVLIQNCDKLIKQKKSLEMMMETEGWKIFESALKSIRREALEGILASGPKDDRGVYIGYAQAMNYLVNFLSTLIKEGKVAEERKKDLLYTIKEASLEDQESEERTVYRDHVPVG